MIASIGQIVGILAIVFVVLCFLIILALILLVGTDDDTGGW